MNAPTPAGGGTEAHPCLLLHIVPNYGIGGVELAAESAAIESEGRLRVHFLALRSEQPLPGSSPWVTFGPKGSSFGIRAIIRGYRQVRSANPDILLFSLWRSCLFFLLARVMFPRKTFVLFLHNEVDVHWLDTLGRKLMTRLADYIWGDSQISLSGHGVDEQSGRVISMLLHRPPDNPAGARSNAGPEFLSWCRLNRQKRIDRALRLIAKLKDRIPAVRYIVAGPDNGELPALQDLVKRLGLEDNVSFVGPKTRQEIERAAANSTFFLQLSDYEGVSMSVMEAMQLGLVPVVTPVGAISTYSADGVDAIYVDDLDDAAARIADALDDPGEVSRLSEAARARFSAARYYTADVLEAANIISGGG